MPTFVSTNFSPIAFGIGAASSYEVAGAAFSGTQEFDASAFSITYAQGAPPRWPGNRLFCSNGGGGIGITEQIDAKISEFIANFNSFMGSLPSKDELLKDADPSEFKERVNRVRESIIKFKKDNGDSLEAYFSSSVPPGTIHSFRIRLFIHSAMNTFNNRTLLLRAISDRVDYHQTVMSDRMNKFLDCYEEMRAEKFTCGKKVTACNYLVSLAQKYTVNLEMSQDTWKVLEKLDVYFFADIIYNFVTNIAKYCPTDRKPTLKVSFVTKNGFPILAFEDNAGGIPQDVAAKIGKENVHGDPAKQGTGEGLFLTYNLIKELGGKIWFETESGKGTTFYIHLPDGAIFYHP